MNLLLDSHTLLWYAQSNAKLSHVAELMITDPMNRLHFSMASVWEIGIKSGLGKLNLTVSCRTFLNSAINKLGLFVLPITIDDCIRYEALPFPDKNHRDPFDRMIVVHALRDGLTVVGVDAAFDPYGVTRVW